MHLIYLLKEIGAHLVVLQVEQCSRAVGIAQRQLLRIWKGRAHPLQ